MKQLIFFKFNNNPTVNHIYEHLIAMSLTTRLRQEGYLQYLDYDLDARSYRSGFISLDISLYSPSITVKPNDLKLGDAALSTDNLEIAYSQISAEQLVDLRPDPSIQQQIRNLDSSPWLSTRDISTYNAREVDTNADPPELRARSLRNFSQIHCSLQLDQQYTNQSQGHIPLFEELTQILLHNLSNTFTDKYGYFGLDSTSAYTNSTTEETHIFRIPRHRDVAPSALSIVAQEAIRKMIAEGLPERTAQYLKQLCKATDSTPATRHILDIFDRTGVLVGHRGWELLATSENIGDILDHTFITIKSGKESVTERLKLS